MSNINRKWVGPIVGAGLVLLVGAVCYRYLDNQSRNGAIPSEPASGVGVESFPADVEIIRIPGESALSVPLLVSTGGTPAGVVAQESEEVGGVGEEKIRQLKASTLRPRDFQARIRNMAIRGDQESVDTLVALSNEGYEELEVVKALGEVRNQEQRQRVGEHLRGKIVDRPLNVMMAAHRSYARVMGDEAIPVLKGNIRDQWRRPDGFGELVCQSVVEALGSVQTPAAQKALEDELERVTEAGWLPDYGSAVVKQLAKRRNQEAAVALRQYAEALERKMPPADNPPGRIYYQEKIEEARNAASGRLLQAAGRSESQTQGKGIDQ